MVNAGLGWGIGRYVVRFVKGSSIETRWLEVGYYSDLWCRVLLTLWLPLQVSVQSPFVPIFCYGRTAGIGLGYIETACRRAWLCSVEYWRSLGGVV